MQEETHRYVLLASGEPALLAAMEPVLTEPGVRVQVAMSGEAALASMLMDTPALALVDARLPGMELGRLLAAVRGEDKRFPIVLISDTVSEELKERLVEGIIDDLVPPAIGPEWLRVRVEMALRAGERTAELERLRDQAARDVERDPLTGVWNRNAMLGLLFRETDRVQRMNTNLSVILFDIDDFGHWNARLGTAACDGLLLKVAERVGVLLRSYDLLGRVGKDEFLAALPGCSMVNGGMLAERMRTEIFGEPYAVAGRMVRLSACFGVVASRGRSPVVVLREAEEMLRVAKAEGLDTIQCAGECPEAKVWEIGK
ncbi:MAG TPA: diguanylate cyclase [Terracidiphilus sp.]|jgi:diguanylate cyclase (GGDEF)-like protein|nr:diguanylate cyclase [Terracidiphilus sp.]